MNGALTREVIAYSAALNEPLTRMHVTHYHSEHLLGATAFALPVHALVEVKARVAVVGGSCFHTTRRQKHEDLL